MLPGKTYSPVDFLMMGWRRKWLIVIPAIVVGAGTFVWARYLPNVYRSEVSIVIVPQRVPEEYVRSTVTTQIEDRLQMISQQLLSRTRLERIINEFDLYKAERETMIMEDIIERMRTVDIRVGISAQQRRGNEATAFTVAYESPQARTAMLVADRIGSMFVQENLQDREILADQTNQFLQAQLEDARRRLIEHEKKLQEFNEKNAGHLPSEVQSNLAMLQNTQMQLQASIEAGNRERDRLLVLDAAISEAVAAAQDPRPVAASPTDPASMTAAQQLEVARTQLKALEVRLKPEHPDVARMKRAIQQLEAKAEAEALANPVSPDPAAAAGPRLAPDMGRLAQMRLESQEIRARLEGRKRDEERLQKAIATYGARLESAPGLASAQVELTRDYATIQEQYTTLLRKSEESKIAVNLERRQIGEQFKIIDGARLPERPIRPDRMQLNLMGLIGGLGLGLALAALLEYRDTTFKTDDDVAISLSLPVLAVIPAMVNSVERHKLKRRKIYVAVAASVTSLLMVAAVVAWRLQLIQNWIR
jgi:polysaccharide chain length determinant protein (PEP-CTERM system associated)